MSLEFPRWVFKDGGKLERAAGKYSSLLVKNEAEYDAAIKDSWHASLVEAIEDKKEEINILAPESIEGPTRTELELKAKELGIRFHPSISDKMLSKKIEETLKDL